MSNGVKKLLGFTKPVCNIVKSYGGLLTTLLFLIIVFSMLPLHLVYESNVQSDVLGQVESMIKSSLGQLFTFILFVCLYVNGDIENMLLLLYVFWLINQ